MRKLVLLLFCPFLGIAQDGYERQPDIDALSYAIEIELNDSNNRITAKSEIEFAMKAGIKSFFLDLSNEREGGHAACSEDHPSKRERHETYVWGVQLSESQASMEVRITNAGKDYSISDKDGSAYGGIQAETLGWRKLRELVDGIHARGQNRYASAVEKAVSVSLESQTKRSIAYSESCAPDTTLVEIAKVFFCNEDGEVLCFKAEGRDYFDGPGTTRKERDDSLQQAVRRCKPRILKWGRR